MTLDSINILSSLHLVGEWSIVPNLMIQYLISQSNYNF
jgi:hypothetical protein